MAKLNFSFDDELLKKVEKHAEKMYMSKSGFISYACAQFIAQIEMMSAIQDMALTMRKIADQGEIDQESRVQLEDFERMVKMLLERK